MSTNKGFFKEEEMALRLNQKRVGDLNRNIVSFLELLFGPLEQDKMFQCVTTEGSVKPDVVLTYDGRKRYVSLKSGRSESVHQQIVKDFVLYLRSLGISKRTQQTILLYHYGDGTMDGSAKERFPYEKLRMLLAERIAEANAELNQNNDFIWTVVRKCIFEGFVDGDQADSFYHGDYDDGVGVTIRQMEKYVKRKNWSYLNNLHIGPLLLRPCGRYIGREIVNEKRRQRIEAYWPRLKEDLEYISRHCDDTCYHKTKRK